MANYNTILKYISNIDQMVKGTVMLKSRKGRVSESERARRAVTTFFAHKRSKRRESRPHRRQEPQAAGSVRGARQQRSKRKTKRASVMKFITDLGNIIRAFSGG